MLPFYFTTLNGNLNIIAVKKAKVSDIGQTIREYL